MKRMEPELARQWCEALESGKYKQGKAVLRDENGGFCCLGVLADIVAPEDWRYSKREGRWLHRSDRVALADPMWKDLGIDFNSLIGSIDRRSLGALNDGGKTFKEIAEYIKTELELT